MLKKSFTYLSMFLMVVISQFSWAADEDTVEHYTTSPTALFSSAVRVGNILYLSGQIGRDPATGKLAEGGVEAETHQIMKNIKATLEKYGSSLDEVVKCTVFMADTDDREVFNKAYRSYFGDKPPARSGVGNLVLALNAAAEVECMATVGLKKAN